jgi:hypothetical protein
MKIDILVKQGTFLFGNRNPIVVLVKEIYDEKIILSKRDAGFIQYKRFCRRMKMELDTYEC